MSFQHVQQVWITAFLIFFQNKYVYPRQSAMYLIKQLLLFA